MRVTIRVVACASAMVALGSCLFQADNAVLEVTISYPALPDGYPDDEPLYAVVQARPHEEEVELGIGWSSNIQTAPRRLERRPLDPEAISIVAEGEIDASGTGDLILKVLFCRTQTCEATVFGVQPVFAEVWYRVEQPFYRGESTRVRIEVPGVPTCRTCVENADCQLELCAADGPCECVASGGNEMSCYARGTTNEQCLAVEPPAPADFSECTVALHSDGHPVWSCVIDRCRVAGCLGGTTASYCEELPAGGDGPHACEND